MLSRIFYLRMLMALPSRNPDQHPDNAWRLCQDACCQAGPFLLSSKAIVALCSSPGDAHAQARSVGSPTWIINLCRLISQPAAWILCLRLCQMQLIVCISKECMDPTWVINLCRLVGQQSLWLLCLWIHQIQLTSCLNQGAREPN